MHVSEYVSTYLKITGLCRLSSCLTYEYHFANMNKNWTEAQSYCREKYTDLVTIDNPEEMNRVINSVNLTGYTGPAWIGLEKGNSWKWKWSLEERRLYTSITPTHSGTWDDRQCGEKHPFLCYDGELK
uniref:C-type lectin domain-containing protein n=1 Tax=Scleropages formosus TaxID=113540 RepID=A0A8C9T847_SCLFO